MKKVDFAALLEEPPNHNKGIPKKAKEITDVDRVQAAQFAAKMVEQKMQTKAAYLNAFPEREYTQDGKKKKPTTLTVEANRYSKMPHVREAVRDLTYKIYNDLSDPKTGVIQMLVDAVHMNILDLFEDDGSLKTISDLKKLPLSVQKVINEIEVTETSNANGITRKVRVRNMDKLRSIQTLASLLSWLKDSDERDGVAISDLIADSKLADREALLLRRDIYNDDDDCVVVN